MHIDVVPNRSSPPAILLRESYREGKQVKKRTLANLSGLPMEQVDAIRRILKGEKLAPVESLFECIQSHHHGHVEAVRSAMRRLGFEKLLGSNPSRERSLVTAMVAAQILDPDSKLATTRWWHTTTLAEGLGVADANEDELYRAMDWLLERQPRIEKKLAAKHLEEGGIALYDLSSSYFEGSTCPLAALGHNRDGKTGKLQVNYGLLANSNGCPVAVSVFKGNTGDPKTVMPQVTKLRDDFGIKELVLVGDRGMISQKQINKLGELEGMDWITALKTGAIRKLFEGGHIQLGLFDERNLFGLSHPDFPNERLVACRNVELGKLRAHKRESLLQATTKELEKVKGMVSRGRLKGKAEIGVRLGKVINKYKVAKHFTLEIGDDGFEYHRKDASIAAEAALDGIYVIRTSLPKERMDDSETVRTYKMLSGVERAFRSLKSMDIEIRPIRHRVEDRVRGHIFLCMLAYYVTWHMLEAWRPLLFSDEDQTAKKTRDPVAPAQRSEEALAKVASKQLDDGSVVHSFRSLLKSLSSIVTNTCRRPGAKPGEPTFQVFTQPDANQQRAYKLLEAIAV